MSAVPPSPSSSLACFDAAYAEMVGFLTRRTGNADDARELVHDTWLRLAEGAGAQAGAAAPDHARAYLFAVAQNVAMDFLRRRQWMHEYLREQAGAMAQAGPREPDVADTVMYRQALQAVVGVLDALPERARTVFLAHRLGGEGQQDIAARLDVSRNTVERDVMLASARIEAALTQWRGPRDRPAARPGRRRSLAALLGLAGFGCAGAFVWRWVGRAPAVWEMALESPQGEQRRHALPDGSVLLLDAASAVSVRYAADRRALALQRGAAFFEVQRDATRPFVVQALEVRVTVLGTRFGVGIDGGTVQVEVESGRVAVRRADAGADTVLGAGQALSVPARGALQPAGPGPRAASWRDGELAFQRTPLRDALARLERHLPLRIVLAPQVAELPVSGMVRIADAREWLQALPAALPVRVERQADGGLRIGPR